MGLAGLPLFFSFLFLFVCVLMLYLSECMCTTCVPGACGGPEEDVRAPGTGVTICCELPCYQVGAENQMGLL